SGEIEDNNKLRNYLRGIGVKSSKMGVCEQDETDQREQANLSFKRLSYNEELNVSLVEVILETGQRHQIRVQLAHHGFPILGDEIYGGTKAQRVFLHSYLYKINLLDSEVEIKAREVSLFDRFFDLNSFL
ncbi:MAG: 23S rRNA-/tRNA-specific pseudouridylate synthase, partial [Thermoproteota archaeon]